VFCAAAAVFAGFVGATWLVVVLAVLALVAAVDFGWVVHRKRRGEPG
jgi:hypothetical protein